MTRRKFCEQIQRIASGGVASDDTDLTLNFINLLVNQGIALAVKANYADNLKMDGIGYVNSSFYTTFKGLTITKYDAEDFCYTFPLPEIPIALGHNDGLSQMLLKSNDGKFSYTGVQLTAEQVPFRNHMRKVPTRFYYWYERNIVLIGCVFSLTDYTANIRMASGGSDSTDLSSTIYIPNEWLSFVQDYVVKNLIFERQQPQDLVNDGVDNK